MSYLKLSAVKSGIKRLGEAGPEAAMQAVRNELRYWYLLLRQTIRMFIQNRGPYQANALAYRSMISLVPMLAFMISLFSWLMGTRLVNLQERLREIMADYFVPESDMVAQTFELIERFTSQAEAGAGYGFLILLATSILLISGVEVIFNNIWRVTRRRPYAWRVLSYTAMMLLIPLLLGFSIYMTAQFQVAAVDKALRDNVVISHIPFFRATFGLIKDLGAPLLFVWALFFFMYKWLPNTRVETWPALTGALIASIMFEVCKWGFSIFAAQMVSNRQLWWGTIGVFLVFLVWLYLIWWIVLFCSQMTYVIQNYRYVFKKGHALEGRIGDSYLSARVMLEIARRHLSGEEPPPSVLELAESLEVEVPRVQAVLSKLAEANIVLVGTSARRRGDYAEVYVPARDLGNIYVYQVTEAVTNIWQMPPGHPAESSGKGKGAGPRTPEEKLDALLIEKLGQTKAGLEVSFRELLEGGDGGRLPAEST